MAAWGRTLFAFGTCFGVALGCGGRTDTQLFDDVPGAGESSSGGTFGRGGSFGSAGVAATGNGNPYGGTVGVGGGYPTAGSFGFPQAGNFGVAGGFPAAGSFGFGGSVEVGGGFPTAGTVGVGGGVEVGGSFGFGGSFGMAGTGATNSGGSGGFTQLCEGLANTSCDRCLCSSCSSQIDACFADPACFQMFVCVGVRKCKDLACVVNCAGTNGGQATLELLSLGACSTSLRPACGCN